MLICRSSRGSHRSQWICPRFCGCTSVSMVSVFVRGRCARPAKAGGRSRRADGRTSGNWSMSRQMGEGRRVRVVFWVAPRSIEFPILLPCGPSAGRQLTWLGFQYLIHHRSARVNPLAGADLVRRAVQSCLSQDWDKSDQNCHVDAGHISVIWVGKISWASLTQGRESWPTVSHEYFQILS